MHAAPMGRDVINMRLPSREHKRWSSPASDTRALHANAALNKRLCSGWYAPMLRLLAHTRLERSAFRANDP